MQDRCSPRISFLAAGVFFFYVALLQPCVETALVLVTKLQLEAFRDEVAAGKRAGDAAIAEKSEDFMPEAE